MAAFFIIFFGLVIAPPAGLQEFGKHSNGSGKYVFVDAAPCSTGLRDSGFAYVPSSNVILKQVNLDGTVGRDICKNN